MALPVWLTAQAGKAFTAAVGAAVSYSAAVVTTGGYPELAQQTPAWWIGGAIFVVLSFLGVYVVANTTPPVAPVAPVFTVRAQPGPTATSVLTPTGVGAVEYRAPIAGGAEPNNAR